jgi:hypothetical protein
MKRVALVGSSGGNLYQLGGANPAELISQVRTQLTAAGIDLAAVVFVGAARSLDRQDVTDATLWELAGDEPHARLHGAMEEINALALEGDEAVAEQIAQGTIDGLIFVSADPQRINAASTRAAAAKGIPATGSGGTSTAAAEQAGVRFVASSGTTGTNNVTRAITFTMGFAKEWGLPYTPAAAAGTAGSSPETSLLRQLDPRPILSDALPGVIPICVALGVVRYLPAETGAELRAPLLAAIGVVISVFAATKVTRLAQTGLIAGVIGGVLATGDGLISLFVAGVLAGLLGNWIMARASAWQWPSTMNTILASGGAGVVGGLCGHALGFASQRVDTVVLDAIDQALVSAGLWIGLVVGLAMWPMIRRGLYHTLVIPLMVVEFEGRGQSFLATADVIGLVVAAAGVAAAYALIPRRTGDRRGALHTLRITTLFGDYVEGVYPFFDNDRGVLAIAVVAAGVGTAIAGYAGARGMSYVPPWVLPLVGTSALALLASVLATFAFAFVAAATLNLISSRLRAPVAG